jgi:hypothetical protein
MIAGFLFLQVRQFLRRRAGRTPVSQQS